MTASDTPAKRSPPAIGDFLARYGIVLSFMILFVALALANPNFLSTINILNVLRQVEWVLGGPKGAAARLGMARSTLQWKMKKLGISRPE